MLKYKKSQKYLKHNHKLNLFLYLCTQLLQYEYFEENNHIYPYRHFHVCDIGGKRARFLQGWSYKSRLSNH